MIVFNRFILLLLGVWAFVFGLLQVSNLKIEAMTTFMGFSALILGIVCLIAAIVGFVQQQQTPKV